MDLHLPVARPYGRSLSMERRADPTFSVSTGIQIAADPMVVWERLCDSEMPATAPCEFRLGRPFGVPQPIRCELPDGPGGVGASRRGISNRGVINQRITEWMPGARLAFDSLWVFRSTPPLISMKPSSCSRVAGRFEMTPES